MPSTPSVPSTPSTPSTPPTPSVPVEAVALRCLAPPPLPGRLRLGGAAPDAETFGYDLTLPSSSASPTLARAAVGVLIDGHGLAAVREPVLQALGELVDCACRFAGTDEVGVTLRWQEGEVWVVARDGHRRHRSPHLAAACRSRRDHALAPLDTLMTACGGALGYEEVPEPGAGTRMWAVLPYPETVAYADVGVGVPAPTKPKSASSAMR